MKTPAIRIWCGIGFRKVLLPLLSICFLVAIGRTRFPPAHADPVPAQTVSQGATRQFSLKYYESTPFVTRLTLGQQEVRFRKEPAFGTNDRIVRQALRTGPNADDYVGFAVNLTTQKLYLDLNLNLDLTDDPAGVYSSALFGTSTSPLMANNPISYFRGVKLTLHNGGVERAYLLEPFYFLNGTSYIGIRSCYQGEVELGGRTLLFQVQDNLDGRFDAQDRFLLTSGTQGRGLTVASPQTGGSYVVISPQTVVGQRGGYAVVSPQTVVGQRAVPISITYAAMPLPQEIFAGGRLYRMKVAFSKGTSGPEATVEFEERNTQMSELALDGQFIRRLVLQGKTGLVILDEPGQKTRLPAGDYSILNAYLQKTPGQPVLVATAGKSRFTAPAGGVCKVRLGAPFVSLVAAERRGSMLQMSYILRGAAGEEYTLNSPDRNNPPKFEVFLKEQVVANGNFQFG